MLGHVILMHGTIEPWSYLTGMGFLRVLVPAFSIVSGYSLYVTYQRGKMEKWLWGLTLVYLFWMAFYTPIWLNRNSTFDDVIWGMTFGVLHLWYVAGLIMAAPLLIGSLWLGKRTGTGNWPMLISASLFFVIGSAMGFWSYLTDNVLPVEVYRNGLTVIFPFAAAGYVIAGYVQKHGRDALPSARVLWLLTAAIFAIKLVESTIVMGIYGVSYRTLPDLPIFAIPAAILLFLAFLRSDLPAPGVNLSLWSASIYFLHIFLIIAARHFGVEGIWPITFIGIIVPIFAAIVFERALALWRPSRKSAGAAAKNIARP